MRWWTSRGERANDERTELQQMLDQAVRWWERRVVHVWDRGFASGLWLCLMLKANIRFVLRWKKRNTLLDAWGEARPAWRSGAANARRSIAICATDIEASETKSTTWQCVTHPAHPQPLWLVVARPGRHYEPWYLLTSEPIRTAEDAWAVVLAYGRR